MDYNQKHIPAGLITILHKHDAGGLKSFLEVLPAKEKGIVFESLLAELYRGNGWLVHWQGGRGDAGADLLLYHPKTPSAVSLIIQAKNHSLPLTFDQTKIELIKFEEKSAPLHNCQNFRLVAVNGYVREAQKLGEFNLLLDGWEHIEKLVNSYDPESAAEPSIELFAHNRITYQRINELWKDFRHVAVVQATGTGKSYLIAKVLADFLDKRKIVLAPSTYILDQQKSKIPWLAETTDYLTYAKLGRMTSEEIIALNCTLIVLDEYHRCGADVWGAGVRKLLDSNPDAKVLGTTATPIRYLDDSRDMSEELFDGIIAEDLSLAEAIVRRILPPPTYISALYTLNEECASLMDEVEASKRSDEEKSEIKREINAIRLDWEKTSGVPEILKKHLPGNINKLIVFCKNQQHLDGMEIEVQRWFLKDGTHQRRKTYRILTADPDSARNFEEFKKAGGKDTVHLLFAIDMLNEGLHIPDVGAVILLRPTESPIIFYQQIGRCIQVGSDHAPIIFDLVNNFQNVRANDFLGDLEVAKEAEARHRSELGLSEYLQAIRVEELAKPIENIFEAIRERLVSWEVMFDTLLQFKVTHGNCNVPAIYKEIPSLGQWVRKQRYLKSQERLPIHNIKRLEQLNFDWNPLDSAWDKMFACLCEYKRVTENCNVSQKYKENLALGTWGSRQRTLKRNGLLPDDKIRLLGEIGFEWDPVDAIWENMFSALYEYKRANGNCNVPREYKKYPTLGMWCTTIRTQNFGEKLSNDKIKRLDEIGFEWDTRQSKWEKMFSILCEYKKTNGHCKGIKGFHHNPLLESWVHRQRTLKTKGQLSDDKIKRLEEIGADLSPRESNWENMFSELCEYKSLNGNCSVPITYKENPSLGQWVRKQRTSNKEGKLAEDRFRQLEEIGFAWKAKRPSIKQKIDQRITGSVLEKKKIG